MAGDKYARRVLDAILGFNVQYVLAPVVPGTVVCLSGAGAWGVDAALIAAKAVAVDHWLCGITIDTLAGGAVQVMSIQVRDATPVSLTEAVLDVTAVTPNIDYLPAGPYPVWRPPNALTQCRTGGAAARSFVVGTVYAIGL